MINLNGHEIRGFIFDMDGVLLDSQHQHRESWVYWAREAEIDVAMDEFMATYFGKSLGEILPVFFPDRVDDAEFLHEMGELKEREYRRMLRANSPGPIHGLPEFLAKAKSLGVPMIVGSSGPNENVQTTIEVLRFQEYFPQWVSGDHVERGKPDPAIFLKCAELLALAPEHCLVFEDSLPGLEAAKNAGSPAIALTTMHEPAEVMSLAEFVAPEFASIAQHLYQ